MRTRECRIDHDDRLLVDRRRTRGCIGNDHDRAHRRADEALQAALRLPIGMGDNEPVPHG
jgi:hypothetical protein